MLGYILIGGIALFGFFALKSSASSHVTVRQPPPPPGTPVVPVGLPAPGQPLVIAPSGYPAIDAELPAAAAALIASYNAHHGCMGLDTLSVRRFQQALNTSVTIHGFPAPLHADGVYDEATDGFLNLIAAQHYPECVLTFEQQNAPVTTASSPSEVLGSFSPYMSTYTRPI